MLDLALEPFPQSVLDPLLRLGLQDGGSRLVSHALQACEGRCSHQIVLPHEVSFGEDVFSVGLAVSPLKRCEPPYAALGIVSHDSET